MKLLIPLLIGILLIGAGCAKQPTPTFPSTSEPKTEASTTQKFDTNDYLDEALNELEAVDR